jgi:Arc/MetJ family transcription regulator
MRLRAVSMIAHLYTPEGVYWCVVSRTNIDIDDALIAAAQRLYRLDSKRSAVDLALRRLVGEALSVEQALALQGTGFDFTNDEIEAFSAPGRERRDDA